MAGVCTGVQLQGELNFYFCLFVVCFCFVFYGARDECRTVEADTLNHIHSQEKRLSMPHDTAGSLQSTTIEYFKVASK